MDLNWVKINGFKRFEKATLNTSGKVIALLGPNEAGKSSLLEALRLLNSDGNFSKDIHLTRNKEFSDQDIILEAGFILSDEDRQAISHLYQGDSVRWLYISKPVSGQRQFKIKRELSKDMRYRRQVIGNLNTIASFEEMGYAHPSKEHNEEDRLFITKSCREFITELQESIDKDHNLTPILRNRLKEFSGKLLTMFGIEGIYEGEFREDQINIANLKNSIEALVEYESKNPNQQAIETLKNRIPKFLIFGEHDRDLKSSFNLETLDKIKPNKALENLLKIAGLDIEKLSEIFKDHVNLQSKINKANKRIAKAYKDKWSQAEGFSRLSMLMDQF